MSGRTQTFYYSNIAAASLIFLFSLIAVMHAFFGWYFWGQDSFEVGNDDAFISFRYAANLVDHGILSFNPKDETPVEGFSNPLYVLLSAGAYAFFGQSGVYPAMAVIGFMSAVVAMIVIYRYVQAEVGEIGALACLATLVLFPGIWINSTSGLETSLVFLCQVFVWLACVNITTRRTNWAGFALIGASVCLTLLRTDGFIFPLIASTYLLLVGHLRIAFLTALACVVPFCGIMVLRHEYYGLLMPLTFYNKVDGSLLDRLYSAARELAGMTLKSGLFVPLTGLLLATVTWFSWRWHNSTLRGGRGFLPFEVFAGLSILGYFFVIGGDIYRERFLLVLIGMGSAAFWMAAFRLGMAKIALPTMALVASYLLSAFLWDPRLAYVFEYPKYDRAITLGRFLDERHSGEVLAIGTAGKPPFFSGLHVIDMLGLNDRHIAMSQVQTFVPGHGKFDPDYILSRQPDIVCSHVFGIGGLAYFFDRAEYEAAGYRLTYLIRSRGFDGAPVLEVEGLNDKEVSDLIGSGYRYGCALRSET